MPRDVIIERARLDADRANTTIARVREMLANYRSLDDRERGDLIAEYRNLTPVEVALLRSDDGLSENLNCFRADHKKAFRMPFRQYAALLGVAIFGLLVCLYAFLFGS